jgi:cell wall-associated NlpC family hydrolase
MSDALRQKIVKTAQSWLGTPFHDVAGVKGVGVDCAHLLARVYVEAGIIDAFTVETYPPQWFLHHDEERFLGTVLRFAHEIEESAVRPGDCVLYKFGRCFSHGVIVVDWPRHIIHAHKASRAVVASCSDNAELKDRPRRFFSLFDEASAT